MLLVRWTCLVWLFGVGLRTSPARASDPADVFFLKRIYTNSAGLRLPYRVMRVGTPAPATSVPLIVFLHGAIARGEDNEEPLNWGPRLIRDSLQKSNQCAVIVVPQCPKAVGWFTAGSRAPDALTLTVELINSVLVSEFKVDPRRRYLTGVSMGGIGLWS